MLKSFKYYCNSDGNRTHVETKDHANYNNWLLKKIRRKEIFPINSDHWSLMELSFILCTKNAWASFSSHSYNSCEVERTIPLLKFHAIITKNVHVKSTFSGVLYQETQRFSKCQVCLCVLCIVSLIHFELFKMRKSCKTQNQGKRKIQNDLQFKLNKKIKTIFH